MGETEAETRGCATSVLFCFRVSFICDTYVVLAWNSRVKSSPDAHVSFDELHTSIQQNRRPWERRSSQAPERTGLGNPMGLPWACSAHYNGYCYHCDDLE
ncbi:small integral membrane protein 2 [Mus caroli]|uniref:Small integral membrane protein 2 n=1 Tax=Mus caroli TaxID=10089 RepID=A0A6P5QYJ8_MUSCR|nr:small integral membrane protein 2 [Mus caroli]